MYIFQKGMHLSARYEKRIERYLSASCNTRKNGGTQKKIEVTLEECNARKRKVNNDIKIL